MSTKTICWMIRDESGETYIDENCLWLHEADAVEAAGLMGDPDHTYTAFAVASAEPAQPVEAVAWTPEAPALMLVEHLRNYHSDAEYAASDCSNSKRFHGLAVDLIDQMSAALSTQPRPVFVHGKLLVEDEAGFWLHDPNGNDYNGPFETREEATTVASLAHPRSTVEQAGEAYSWPNGCFKSVPAALRFLAENERPRGGEARFNAAHLHQLAREIESAAQPRHIGVPDGWKLVPVQLTDAMREQWMEARCTADAEWAALLAASPAPGKGGEA